MTSDVTVACVCRSGGRYTPVWVERLIRGARRSLGNTAARFVCLSDDHHVMAYCEHIPLVNAWSGWWSKVELFRPELFRGETVLYFDLDTLITGDIRPLLTYDHRFTMVRDFYRPNVMSSTAMAWKGDFSYIYRAFKQKPNDIKFLYDVKRPGRRIGDQAFIEDQLAEHGVRIEAFQDIWGEKSLASYKAHSLVAGPPSETMAVAFHGRPKMNELNGWVGTTWRR
jgi:hypothetical protein